MRKSLFTVFCLTNLFLFNSSIAQNDDRDLEAKLDTLGGFIEAVQEEVGFPGISFAVVKGKEVVFKKEIGYANLEHEVPVSNKTVFPLYSLTKPFISVGIFSLVEKGMLTLNEFASQYVPDLPDSWKEVQIGHLLSHSSGLPDMAGSNPYEIRDYTEDEARKRVFEMPLTFDKGEKYAYNQTNFWLLKEIIEEVSGESLSDFIIKNQFPDSSEVDVFFSADAREIFKNRATAYFPWVKGKLMIDLPYVNGDYFLACNGFNITLDSFIKWDERLRNDQLISKESKKLMWKLFEYSNSEKSFTYGWEVTTMTGKSGYGFSGAMATFYRTYPSEDLSVIFLSNGFSSMYSQDALVNGVLSILLK